MAMQYINQIKNRRRSSQIIQPPRPVLTASDENFLQQVTSQPESAPEPVEKNDEHDLGSPVQSSQQAAVNEGPHDIPLPASPAEEFGKELGEQERKSHEKSENTTGPKSEPSKPQTAGPPGKKRRWSVIFWKKNRDTKKEKEPSPADKRQSTTTTPPSTVATASTSSDNGRGADKDAEDMTDILERLNLAAENNRVFSISAETQELLRKFNLILQDLVNGVPTAYNDLEMLLTNGNRQLQDTYTKLPGFLQKLIEKLPERWTEYLAPEILAAASERASRSGVNMDNVGKAAAAAEKMGINVPSLKELVAKPAALIGMLRSIMAFLRARFPAVIGMNVLWSLALFILLFVLWYCHKRGREVRLENERLVTEDETSKLNEDSSEGNVRPTETLATTAPQGAAASEVREGIQEVEQSRASAVESERPSANDENTRPVPPPSRSRSRLSIWSRSKPEAPPDVTPYPGT